jgi:hypothetical protein
MVSTKLVYKRHKTKRKIDVLICGLSKGKGKNFPNYINKELMLFIRGKRCGREKNKLFIVLF